MTLSVVLVRTHNPGNLGAAARAAKNFGAELLLLQPRAEVFHPDAVAFASGAEDLLRRVKTFAEWDDAARRADDVIALSSLRGRVSRGLPPPTTFEEISSLPAAASVAAVEIPGPEDLYCLLYTSGTTGKPKGVMVPHRMVGWNAFNTVVSWQLREDDVSPIYTPLYHAGGLGAFLTPIFAIGGTIVLHAGFDAEEVLATIGRERCTVVLGVPTIFRMLREAKGFAGADFSSVRWFASGGAPLPLDLIEAWQARGVVLKQGYGLTEVGVNCFAMTEEESVRKAGSIG
ncbi:MAG: AMP-binding protein, partial [Thermoanaerobaculia bacterium]